MQFDERWLDLYGQLMDKHNLSDNTEMPTLEKVIRSMITAWTKKEDWLLDALLEMTNRSRALLNWMEKEKHISAFKAVDPFTSSFELATAFSLHRAAEKPEQTANRQFTPFTEEKWQHHLDSLHTIWESLPDHQREGHGDLKHPLSALIEAWLLRQKAHQELPENAKVLTVQKMSRVPNQAKTAALASWEKMPDAAVVEVDGVPVSSPFHYRPRRANSTRESTELLKLPGTTQAMDLRLALLRNIEENADIDRRNPLPGDILYLFTFGSALTGPITLSADRLGGMTAGRFTTAGATPKQKALWRVRAWSAIKWASMDIMMPSGHWMPILRIDRGGDLPEGVIRIWPYDWQKGIGHRLTGALTAQSTRSDRSGSFSRLVAGLEDYLAASTPVSRTPRLLQSEHKGGPGIASEFIPYPVLLARSGFHFDLTDKQSYNATAQLWKRLTAQIESKGYLLPSPTGEAEAGDTVEIVAIKKGGRGGVGGLIVRASARYIEAHEIIRRARGRVLDAVPLPNLFPHDVFSPEGAPAGIAPP